MPPDVCLVSLYPPPGRRHAGRSGVASYTANLAHALAGRGARVTVIAPEEEGCPTSSMDGDVLVERRFRLGPAALPQAARAVREMNGAVVHLQFELFLYGGPTSAPGLAPALAAMRRPVLTLHQVVDPGAIDRSFVRHHRVRAPVPLARAGARTLLRGFPRLAGRTIVHEPAFARVVPRSRVVPHGIEELRAPDREQARRDLDLDGRPTVLCFGFLAPYKGLEAALGAAEVAGDAFRLVIAGGEHPRMAGRDGYAEALRSRWGEVARFTGYVPEEDIPRWFAAADLALFPYPSPFSSSGALALALGYGTPVLLSEPLAACTGAPAVLSTPTHPVSLARRLVEVLHGSDLHAVRDASGALARGRVWSEIAERHLEVYDEVAG